MGSLKLGRLGGALRLSPGSNSRKTALDSSHKDEPRKNKQGRRRLKLLLNCVYNQADVLAGVADVLNLPGYDETWLIKCRKTLGAPVGCSLGSAAIKSSSILEGSCTPI